MGIPALTPSREDHNLEQKLCVEGSQRRFRTQMGSTRQFTVGIERDPAHSKEVISHHVQSSDCSSPHLKSDGER